MKKTKTNGTAGRKKGSIIIQVAVLFLIGVLITGVLTYVCENYLYDKSVKQQMEIGASQIAEDARRAVCEYPAYEWLIKYWYEHPEELDVEYDALYVPGSKTEEKCRLFSERHPDLQLKYMTAEECEALPEEDRKLYAEITYSWLITGIDRIKQAYHVDYLFCVITKEPFDKQFFLFSGAEPGAVRGTNYEEVYPLGHVVDVAESQRAAMREATEKSSHLADAGSYVDYYSYLTSFDDSDVLIGLTYDLSAIRASIGAQTRAGATMAILNHLALSAICLALIYMFVLRPLKKVQKSIRRYEQTKDSADVAEELSLVRSRNEIGHLAADVSEMAREIDSHVERIRSITAERERISTELTLATRIQAAMLPNVFPPFPDRGEFDLYASMDPAKEVGGDFYDFFLTDDDHLALVIADVSGKGIPAALFMMVSKILVKNHIMSGLSPAAALEAVNRQICANNREEMFVTVWLGVLEISTGKLTAANAGHEYPVLKSADGEFEILKDRHGLVIGAMETSKYKEYEITLEPGSKLFVYTDGVPEATDAQNELFGTERMVEALNSDCGADPERMLKNVREAVNAFVKDAEQFDDLTMLGFEYRGKR